MEGVGQLRASNSSIEENKTTWHEASLLLQLLHPFGIDKLIKLKVWQTVLRTKNEPTIPLATPDEQLLYSHHLLCCVGALNQKKAAFSNNKINLCSKCLF